MIGTPRSIEDTPARQVSVGPTHHRRKVAALWLSTVLVALAAALCGPGVAQGEENPLEPLDTSSPQATYLSFVKQVEVLEDLLLAYERSRTEANQLAFSSALDDVEVLFDLSEVTGANEGEVGAVSFARLADILNRIPPPDIDEMPDADDVAEAGGGEEFTLPGTDTPLLLSRDGVTNYTLPGTEISITRLEEGARAGSYVFSADTVDGLADWRDDVDGLSVKEGVEVRNWVRENADFTGHLVPRSLVEALPGGANREFLGSPLWKFVVDLVVIALVGIVTWLWHRLIGCRGTPGTTAGYVSRLSTTLLLLVLTSGARRFMSEQFNHSGGLATIVNVAATVVIWVALAWAFWLTTKLIVEWIIATPTIRDDSIDAHLLRLLAKVVSVVGAFLLMWVGLSRVGVPTVGLGIGAGVAGLAVGLAATSTLENLLGGITVYADKPFRVGDKINVDEEFGTVEAIGPRSTRIRRLDDTRVTLPNADISRQKITNYSERKHILFVHVVGVRYETTPEQLRRIVESIDSRFRVHPMVLDDAEFPRVRVVGYGTSSIDIEVRARIDTDDYFVFTGVQQELLLLIYEIVETAGAGFAFPSTTTYLADDPGPPRPSGHELLPVSATAPKIHSPEAGGLDSGAGGSEFNLDDTD